MYVWCVHVCGHSHENTKIPQLNLFPNVAFLNTCTMHTINHTYIHVHHVVVNMERRRTIKYQTSRCNGFWIPVPRLASISSTVPVLCITGMHITSRAVYIHGTCNTTEGM